MRPNVEITHTLQGRIKDFAEGNDQTLSEAYTELLEAGLETLETQPTGGRTEENPEDWDTDSAMTDGVEGQEEQ